MSGLGEAGGPSETLAWGAPVGSPREAISGLRDFQRLLAVRSKCFRGEHAVPFDPREADPQACAGRDDRGVVEGGRFGAVFDEPAGATADGYRNTRVSAQRSTVDDFDIDIFHDEVVITPSRGQ